jgi:ribosomal protein S16
LEYWQSQGAQLSESVKNRLKLKKVEEQLGKGKTETSATQVRKTEKEA